MNFKILIAGSGNEGKTTYVYKLALLGHGITELEFISNYGLILVNIKTSNIYEEDHDAEIIMFDLSRPNSLSEIPPTDKPRVIVGNKSDLDKQQLKRRIELNPWDMNIMK